MFFLACNLGLLEITEREPCMLLLNTDILAGNAADSDTVGSGKPRIVSYCVKRSMSNSVAVLQHI